MKDEHSGHAHLPPALISAVRRLLKPLVRLLMKFGVTFPQLVEWLKHIYVDVAEHEFTLENKPQTDTRVSLLTGIHRKDVKRLRQQVQGVVTEPEIVSQGTQMVSRWISDPVYLDEAGQPRALPHKSKDEADFESLVKSVCKQDIRPRVVLDEWLRLGIVSEDASKKLLLNVDAFIPNAGLEEKAFFLGMNVADHLSAATHNMSGEAPPYFERCVYYHGLSADAVAQLRQLADEQGMKLLKQLNDKAQQLKTKPVEKMTEKQRINIGLYVYNEPAQEKPGDS